MNGPTRSPFMLPQLMATKPGIFEFVRYNWLPCTQLISKSNSVPLVSRTHAIGTEVSVQCVAARCRSICVLAQVIQSFGDVDVGFQQTVVVHERAAACRFTVGTVAQYGALILAVESDIHGIAEAA